MRRFLFTYSYTGEAEQDFEAATLEEARATMWKWLEEAYPNDGSIEILEVEEITTPQTEAP